MLLSTLLLLAQNAGEQGAKKPEGDTSWLLLPLLIFGAFYFIILLPMQRKERKQREAVLSAVKKNDEVVTAGGIIGVVQNIKDDEIVIKIDDNAKMRVLKSSIVRIITKDAPTPAT